MLPAAKEKKSLKPGFDKKKEAEGEEKFVLFDKLLYTADRKDAGVVATARGHLSGFARRKLQST